MKLGRCFLSGLTSQHKKNSVVINQTAEGHKSNQKAQILQKCYSISHISMRKERTMRKIKQFIVLFCVCITAAGVHPCRNTAVCGEETIGHLQKEVRTLNRQIRRKQQEITQVKQEIRQTKYLRNVVDDIQEILPWDIFNTQKITKTLNRLKSKHWTMKKDRNRAIAKKEYTKEKIKAIKYQKTHPAEKNEIPSYALTPKKGVVYYNGHRETYYSQRVLPGGGLNIPGRHVAKDGTIRDQDGNICVANIDYPKGTIIQTSLGRGKIYDTGCASGTVDIYTDW